MNYHNTEAIIIRNGDNVFGSGDHESTQMVLEALYQQNPKCKKVLDIGTGTGIQSIFAKKWGATDVMAVDIDINAIKTARKNFQKNSVEVFSRLNIYNEFIEDKFDIIIANLPSDSVRDFLTMAQTSMEEDSKLIVSWDKQFNFYNECDLSNYNIVEHLEGINWDAYVLEMKK